MVELENFLKQNLSSKGEIFTNTRIPCNKNNIYCFIYTLRKKRFNKSKNRVFNV